MKKKVEHLLKKSEEVIADCVLDNGAVVAANSNHPAYPQGVKDYRFVWPRDAAFVLYAAELLGLFELDEGFVSWLLNRAEGFSETGMLFQRYEPNGSRDPAEGGQYQPDQAGAVLWAFSRREEVSEEKECAIFLLAEGLCRGWSGDRFSRVVHDLWEERAVRPGEKKNFTYTLAVCSFGLAEAAALLSNSEWKRVSEEMRSVLEDSKEDRYGRVCGDEEKDVVDASVMGLVWPFTVVFCDKRLINTLKIMEEVLLAPEGVYRYESDTYDGGLHQERGGAGGWPLLTFWYVTVLAKMGERRRAAGLFYGYIKHFDDYIPEQVFKEEGKPSVSPLAWSHAMFMIAAYELGFTVLKE